MSELELTVSNSKSEKIIFRNLFETMEKGGVTITDSGTKVDFTVLETQIDFTSFKDEILNLISKFGDLVLAKEITVPETLKEAISNFATGKFFASEVVKIFETTTDFDRPAYTKTLFKYIMYQIEGGKIPQPNFLLISKEYVKDFETWFTKEFDSSITKEQKAQLHYLYTLSGNELFENRKLRVTYTKDTIKNPTSSSSEVGHIGDIIVYPSTGKMISYEYGGVQVQVPEYDSKYDGVVLKAWDFSKNAKYPSSIDATRAYSRYYYRRNLGVFTMFTKVTVPGRGTVKLPFGKYNHMVSFPVEENQQWWISRLSGMTDTGVRCIVVPGNYSTEPATSNLDPFQFGTTDWLTTIEKNFNLFKGKDYVNLTLSWVDASKKGSYIIDSGEHLDEDGGLSGTSTVKPDLSDEWLDAIQRGDNWQEIAQNVENADLPGFVIDPETGEVVGKPGMSIPEAEENLQTNYPSMTTNPSALGLNVYYGRFSDVKSVIEELWRGDFVDKIAKILTNPLEAVVGILTVPVLPDTNGSAKVQIGNYTANVSMGVVNRQFKTVNLGMFDIVPLYEGTDCSYLDYEQTKVFLYVPYCGMTELPVSSVMGTSISISLTIDVMTGLCCANIYSDGKFINCMDGDCSYKYPLSGVNYSENYGTTLGSIVDVVKDFTIGGGTSIRGSVSGSPAGYVNNRCYLIIHRPIPYYEDGGGVNRTFATLRRGTLAQFTGYVVCSKVYQPNGDFGLATKEELTEIDSLLRQGVYV